MRGLGPDKFPTGAYYVVVHQHQAPNIYKGIFASPYPTSLPHTPSLESLIPWNYQL